MSARQPGRAVGRRDGAHRDGERGAMHVAAIPAVAGLLALAVLLILVLGSATSDKRQSTTAADAAALAAVQEWDRRLGNIFDVHVGLGDHAGFWGLAGLPGLGAPTRDAMRQAASEYAERNGAELVDFDVHADRREVLVRVRNDDTVPETETRMDATATARIELTGGLCMSGGLLGYAVGGSCVTRPEPEPTPTPTPTPTETPDEDADEDPDDEEPSPTPTPTPTFEAPSVGVYRSDVVLVD